MAVSRPVLLALVGAVLVAALFLATMGGRARTDDSVPPPAATSENGPKTSGPAATAKGRAPAAATATKAGEKRKAAAAAGVPAAVLRALARKRTVVLFFRQRGSADDDATARAVAPLRGRLGLAVFSASISRLADYRAITDQAGVSQAPAAVVVGRSGRARLIEGFVDRDSLAQEVADAR